MEKTKKKGLYFEKNELRIIAISLSILSCGLAIAWIGFAIFSSK